ncbi:fusaric acid resistance protein [Acetobacter pasteurianus NBRC 3299]|uniref:Multidrug resistance protein MdtO n=2 Tax=Acetobacter ascendens TaxID=481146 RepID=A0A1Y0V9C6_9PROT|nr:Multidrug resistance protein MdtO [Acetobacter ascendens]GCD75216.1 fusaric acid resistance protein [Acetobacter pasteurianus NBRC 3299]
MLRSGMVPPATDLSPKQGEKDRDNSPKLSLSRIWTLVCNPAPGRLGYALRMAAGCTATVLVGEIWQVPDLAVPALVTMALWQKDRVTNALAAIGINIIILFLLAFVYGLIRLTLDHSLWLIIVIALLSFGFFFLGSASKLKPVAYMLGLIIVYALIAIDQVPVGEIVTRAILYADLFLAVPGAVMVLLGLLICPSPKTLLTEGITERLKLSVSLLQNPDTTLLDRASCLLHTGASEMMRNVKMAKLEKIWSQQDLACLQQAANASVAVLALSLNAARSGATASAELLSTLNEMAVIFARGDYPTNIAPLTNLEKCAALHNLALLLPTFTTPITVEAEKSEKNSGFFSPDAFSNPDHIRFAVKGTAAVMSSYLLFKILDWPGIHTCIITCFIVALPTTGEMISKLNLRITGALIGGAIGILSIIWVMPHLDGITGFLILIFSVSLLAAWVKTGDQRIAYAGFQIGLAFYLTDLNGYGPTSDMTTARDRIVGIMIGNFITYAIFTSFWPASARDLVPAKLTALFHLLRKQATAPTLQQRETLFAQTQSALDAAKLALEYTQTEPAHPGTDTKKIQTQLATWHNTLIQADHLATNLLEVTPAHTTAYIEQLERNAQ